MFFFDSCFLIINFFFYHFSEIKSPTVQLIREIYETDNAHEHFISELDKALISKADYIIIEPSKLGDETGRWIMVGNCLNKTAIVSGVASIASGTKLIIAFANNLL